VVFRDYHIISGKPAKKAEAMHRDFLAAGGKIEWHRCDDECADATFSHPQGGSMRITWDNARVQQAQLTGNAMHKKYPRQMKRSRVISEGVRSVFPMATSGLYETGEVQDIVADAPSAAVPTPTAKRARDIEPAPQIEEKPAKQTAEEWAADHMQAIAGTADIATLDELTRKSAKAMAKLAADHPATHEALVNASNARAAELAQEGKPDADMGEGFTDAADWEA